MLHFYFKAFHIIGFVAWFAGMFYLGRLFVYHAEANDLPDMERDILKKQYNLMEWRVYRIIINPAMVLTFVFGTAMLINNTAFLEQGWMHAKILLLLLLSAYHGYCKGVIKKLEKNEPVMDSFKFRLFNEIPTIFLVSIVLLAVFKNMLNFLYAFIGILLFGFLLYFLAKAYRKSREQA